MALTASERWSLGFVRDDANGGLAWTTSLVGAKWWNGFLRDPDGRLVVGAGPSDDYWHGHIRDANGALVLTDGKPFAAGSLRRFAAGTAFAVYSSAFPANTTVLDNFNRANEIPLAAPWDGGINTALSTLNLDTNTARNASGNGGEARIDGPFGPNVDLQAQLATGPAVGGSTSIYARVTDPGGAGLDCVLVTVLKGSPDIWSISKVVNGVTTVLGATVTSATLAAGDRIGLRCSGTTFTAYKFSGGAWSEVLSRTDADVSSAGSVGLRVSPDDLEVVVFDDFLGGTV